MSDKKEKVITLPDADDLAKRLRSIVTSEHEAERFHPILLRHAGCELVAAGVMLMLATAVNEYCKGMQSQMEPLMLKLVEAVYVDVIIDDPDVREETKGLLREILKPKTS